MNLEKANCTISDEKFQFCMFELKIVDFVCDLNDRFSDTVKIIKIFETFLSRCFESSNFYKELARFDINVIILIRQRFYSVKRLLFDCMTKVDFRQLVAGGRMI